MFKKLRKNEKGFTLAELLIVVAIIGVLVAISIPIFTSQLEKAREATDAANLRAAYAEASVAVLDGDGNTGYYVKVNPVQTTAGFASSVKDSSVGSVKLSNVADIVSGTPIYVSVAADGTVTINSTTPTTTEVPNSEINK